MHKEMSGLDGKFRKGWFRRDGLHLSDQGNNRFVRKMLQAITKWKGKQIMLVNQGEWTCKYSKASMTMMGNIENVVVDLLIDTGRFCDYYQR